MKKQRKTLVFEEKKLPTTPKDIIDNFKDKPSSEITKYLYERFTSTAKKEKEENLRSLRLASNFIRSCSCAHGNDDHHHEHNNVDEDIEMNDDNNNDAVDNNGDHVDDIDVGYVDDDEIEEIGGNAFIGGFGFDDIANLNFLPVNNNNEDNGNRAYLNNAVLAFDQLFGNMAEGEVGEEDDLEGSEDDIDISDEDIDSGDDDDDDEDGDGDGVGNHLPFRHVHLSRNDDINLVDTTNDDEKLRLLNESKYSEIRESMWLLGMCEPSQFISKVKRIKTPSQVCGKILEPGEHAYKCSTCENDSSCVLCVDCFEQSKHVGHSYKLIQVVGGCCDCGDPCAWDPAGFCSRHSGVDHHDDLLKYFPADLIEVTRAVVSAMVNAAAQNSVERRENTSINVEIIGALNKLTKLLGCGFGRIVIQELNKKNTFDNDQYTVSDDEPKHPLYGSNLWKLVEHDSLCNTNVKKELYSLYITLLSDPIFKMSIGRVVAALYRTINHNITSFKSTIEKSVMTLNVQVFTVPAYSTPIIRETNLIESLLEEVNDQFKSFIESGFYNPMRMIESIGSQSNMICDLELILDQTQNARLFLRSPHFLEKFVCLLEPLQGAFAYQHKKGEHVEREIEGIDILDFVDNLFTLSFKGLSTVFHAKTADENFVLMDVNIGTNPSASDVKFQDEPLTESERLEALRVLYKGISNTTKKKLKRCPQKLIEYDSEHSVPIVAYDITSKSVSQFNPITRLVSQLIHGYLETGCNADALMKVVSPLELLESTAELFALLAQVEADIWVRNGMIMNAVVNSIRAFSENPSIKENFFILQYCAAVAPRDNFVLTLLNRYGLVDKCSAFTEEGQGIEHRQIVLTRALGDLVEIALNVNSLPHADPRAIARREVIQSLGVSKSQPFGSLSNSVSKPTRTYLNDLLQEVANKTPQTVTTPAKYSLKTEHYSEFDPYDVTLTKQCIGVFEELWADYVASISKKKKKRTPKPIYPCPRVHSAPHPLFENLPSLLSERPIISLIARAICGEFTEGDDHIETRLLTVCLHILMLCAEEHSVCSPDKLESVVLDELIAFREVNSNNENGEKKKCSALSTLCDLYAKDRTFWLLEKVLTSLKKSITNTLAIDMISNALKKEDAASNGDDNDKKEAKSAALKRKSKQESILSKMLSRSASKIEELSRSLGESSESMTPPSKSPHLEEDSSSPCSLSASTSPAPLLQASASSSSMICEGESVCVLCHESGGDLSWIGYCQRSDLINAALRNNKDAVSWKGNCKELNGFCDDCAKHEEPIYEDPLMYYLKRGLCNGVYIHKCNHTIHETCLQKYIETTAHQNGDDVYNPDSIDGRKGLFSCPACKRLSNMTIPVTGILENATFPLTVLFKENNTSDIYDYQDTYLELTRSLAYTIASHELAARPSENNSVPVVPPQKVTLQKVLFNNIITLFSAKDEDDRKMFADILDNMVFRHGSHNNYTLASFEPLNIFILRAILYHANNTGIEENANDPKQVVNTLCGSFLNKLALSELTRIAVTLDKTELSVELAPYLETFLRCAAMVASVLSDTPIEQLCAEVPLFTSLLDAQNPSYNAVTTILKTDGAEAEFSEWAKELASTSGARDRGFSPIFAAPATPFHIVQLPKLFMECIKADTKAICPNCKKHPKKPATCLVCGRIVCALARCCSDRFLGECNIHMQFCLDGAGIYFDSMMGSVLLLRSDGDWGTLWHSPYIDEHGEDFIGHEHNTPLFLSEDRVKQLEKLILEYEIDNTCTAESNEDNYVIPWRSF